MPMYTSFALVPCIVVTVIGDVGWGLWHGSQLLLFVVAVHMVSLVISALKSGPVSVQLPFLEGPRTGPVPESFRMQEPRTGTTKNRKKPVKTGCNWSQNEYIKTRAISVKIGHKL